MPRTLEYDPMDHLLKKMGEKKINKKLAIGQYYHVDTFILCKKYNNLINKKRFAK